MGQKRDRSEYHRLWKEKNREKILTQQLAYADKNKENCRKSYAINREDRKIKQREYYYKHREERLAYEAKRSSDQKVRLQKAKTAKKFRESNLIKAREKDREYSRRNRKKISDKNRERRAKDPEFRIRHYLRNRIRDVIKTAKAKKSATSLTLLGCSSFEYFDYLESLFRPGMTWDNYGKHGWVIDHIRPISSFNMLDARQQQLAFHYKNTQPLWNEENATKGSKYSNNTQLYPIISNV